MSNNDQPPDTPAKEDKPPDTPAKTLAPDKVAEFPAQIKGGKCTNCNAPLDHVIQAIMSGKIPPPNHCPACGHSLRTDIVTRIVERCKHCTALIIDQNDKRCLGCGRIIVRGQQTTPGDSKPLS